MAAGLIAFLLFVAAFIARAIHAGLEAEDYVLWMLAGFAALAFAPVYVYLQTKRGTTT